MGIISERLARLLWPSGDPLGKRITLGIGPDSWLEIVGVVGDVRQDDLRAEPAPGLYVPYQQVSQAFFIDAVTFVVRTAGEPHPLAASIRKTIQAVDPTLPVFDIAAGWPALPGSDGSPPQAPRQAITAIAMLRRNRWEVVTIALESRLP